MADTIEESKDDLSKALEKENLDKRIKNLLNTLDAILERNFSGKEDVENLFVRLEHLQELDKKVYADYIPKVTKCADTIIDTLQNKPDRSLEEFNADLKKLYVFSEIPDYNKPLKALQEVDKLLIQFIENHPEITQAYLEKQISRLLKTKEISTNFNDFVTSKFKSKQTKEGSNAASDNKNLTLLQIADNKIEYGKDGVSRLTFENEKWIFKVFPETDSVIIASENNPAMFVVLQWKDILEKLENNHFDEVAKMAKENFERENSQKERLQAFDLPKDQAISYFRIFPAEHESTISDTLQGSSMLVSTLMSRYPNLQNNPIIFSNNPKKDLADALKTAYDKGTRFFYLDLYNHGSEQEILFKTPLTANDIAEIAHKFPDAKFTISTIACYGGGLRKGFIDLFKKNPDLKTKLAVFLQSKPNIINLAGIQKGESYQLKAFSTYYYSFLMQALQKGASYGKAAATADEKTKEYTYGDPEALIGGELFVQTFSDTSELNIA
ncbi:hypothetical protein HZA39_04630 [Candidatus Peregrinibacteria bacterium]|nr:hypothetical protein [Candidatus Peregrinibacteria bacterium]